MRPDYQSFGFWMRRPTGFTADDLIPFYRDVIGLPVIRYHDPAVLMWAGEDIVFEIKVDDHPTLAYTDPATAPVVPIFRSHDLAATRARLASQGYPPIQETATPYAKTLYILGKDRQLLGFQERPADSPLAADAEALRRWNAGQTQLADLPRLPADMQYLSRIIRHVEDVEKVAAFHRDVLGLDEVGREGDSILLDYGDTVIAEIAPGGTPMQVPKDRGILPDSVILRIHEFDRWLEDLRALSVPFSGELIYYSTGTKLMYIADPEGNLTGLEDRTLWGNYPEDLENDRRWRERQNATAAR